MKRIPAFAGARFRRFVGVMGFFLIGGPAGPLAAAPKGKVPPPRMPTTLEEMLSTVGISTSDVGLRADNLLQPYIPSVAAETLVRPMENVRKIQDWAEETLEDQASPSDFLNSAGRILEDRPAPTPLRPAGGFLLEKSEDVPEWLRVPLNDFLVVLSSATVAVNEVNSVFSPEERAEWDGFVEELFSDSEKTSPEEPAGGETSVARRMRRVESLGRVDRTEYLRAAQGIARALETLKKKLYAARSRWLEVSTLRFRTPAGWVTLGGVEDDMYTAADDDVLLLDFGGDDVYRGRPASGDGRVSVLLDFSGNDSYAATVPHALGAGHWGVGLLCDLAGEDVYQGARFSQGCGVFGAGVLVDEGGGDLYNALQVSQGAAFWGYGFLSDASGDDAYRVDRMGQGFSGIGGLGLLADGRGNDQYLAGYSRADPREAGVFQTLSQGFSIGLRDYAGGGVGALLDGAGHDFYKVDYFGQGASYWFSFGLLYDRDGRDTYVSRRYSQGAGVHSSAGLLMDVRGDDTYLAWGGAQGLGWDFGVGELLDEQGNDIYSADWGAQGNGGKRGLGFFVDNAGSDIYYVKKEHGQGFGDWDAESGAAGFGLFADISDGADRYPDPSREGGVWNGERWGVGADLSSGALRGLSLRRDVPRFVDASAAQEKEERNVLEEKFARALASKNAEWKTAEMLDLAGHWGLDTATPERARRWLLAASTGTMFPAVTASLDCRQTSGYMVQEEIYLRFGAVGLDALSAHLAAMSEEAVASSTASARTKRFGVYYLGLTASTRPVAYLDGQLASSAWRDRASAVLALGRIHDARLRGLAAELAGFLGKKWMSGKEKVEFEEWVKRVGYRDRLKLIFNRQPLPPAVFEKLMERSPVVKGSEWEKQWARFLWKERKFLAKEAEARSALFPSASLTGKIVALLSDGDPSVRQAAAVALGWMGDKTLESSARGDEAEGVVGDRLGQSLADPSAKVRMAAAAAFAAMSPSSDRVLEAVFASSVPVARAGALEASALRKSPFLDDLLKAALKDADWSVRWRAL
ncbi:MAG TPA: hypothetical protein P5079_05450, partial [Elusimicrobiota bacterium]|nr:hypothetical protein [Elusimicrobiota bacterium]